MEENNIYQNLDIPIVAISPMDGVTDAPFRYIHTSIPTIPTDIEYFEFISVEAIVRGIDKAFTDMVYYPNDIPKVVQIFGVNPERFFETAQIACELGFDGIDINMGCPCKTITCKGGGAALISTPELANKIVQSTKEGVLSWLEHGLKPSGEFITSKLIDKVQKHKEYIQSLNPSYKKVFKKQIPVSVKTRIGYQTPEVERWTSQILKSKPAVLALHGRTLKQMYSGDADWDSLKVASKIVKNESDAYFFANGDITDPASAEECLEHTKGDGILVGRACMGDVYIIEEIIKFLRHTESKDSKIPLNEIMKKHAEEFVKIKGEKKIYELRKQFAWYVKNVRNAKNIRSEFVRISTMQDIHTILEKYKSTLCSI